MTEALGDFDPKATYDAASRDYEDASRDFWQYLSTRTVERLALRPGERVLDVPVGTGPSAIAAASAVGTTGRVVGVDYAEQMVAIARDKVRAAGCANVTLEVGDMTALARPDQPYDAIVCVLGLFFVDDMPAVARSFYDLLSPAGGRMGVAVFGERFFDPMRDVFVEAVHDVVPGFDVIQPWCRLDREDVLRQVFDDAGIPDVGIDTDEDRLPLPSPDDWWRIVMGSGLRRTVTAIGEDAAAEVRARCDAYVTANDVREVVSRTRYAIATRA
ncbi:MAG TPA: methyltransferase domain-containing protein [Acidimicrobiales bacterium]